MAETKTVCPYCGVGCGVVVESDGARITAVRGDPDHPANRGRLCTKGATLHLSAAPEIARQVRLLQPMHRPRRGAAPQPLPWDDALDLAADRIAQVVRTRGADALGLYVSGQLLTEDYYVFNKLARALLATNQIDSNSRLCMSSAVVGYKTTLGADAPPACYDDLARAHTVFIAGSNTAWAHPILMRRLEDARRDNPRQRWIVADPRRTETAAMADLHLQLLPGTDVALFHGMLHVMLWEGLTDPAFIAAHTAGFETLRDRVREFTPRHVAQLCGLDEADIVQAARWFAGIGEDGSRRPTLSLYCQGLNQSSSGTDKNVALINLHLATGQIGKPGCGPLSLTGQPNAMGGREVGAMATLLPGHRDLADARDRAELAALWGVPDDLPATPGRTAVEMFEAAADGALELLWIVCTNPAQSLPNQAMVRRALERTAFVIVQEAYATAATCAHADLLLPATTWGEKDGTVTNSERRISRVRSVLPPAGQARADWRIARDVGRRLEQRLGHRRADGRTLFAFETPEQVWLEHRATTRGRDLDIGGLTWARLDRDGPQQWPYPEGATAGAARLYADGRFATADGRARFVAPAARALAQPRDARHPFALTTGRLRDQWHGMTRTGTLARLFAHEDEPAIALHPQDIERRGWREGDLVRVISRQGQAVLPLRASASLRPAQAFVAMHWGGEFVGGADGGGVNALTTPARCPQSGQPELKHTAVRVERAALPWQLVAAAWLPAGEMLQARERLRALFGHFGYASCVPFGREPAQRLGLCLRAAAAAPVDAALLADIERVLGLAGPDTLRYADARRGQHRAVRLRRVADAPPEAATLDAMVLAGDTAAAGWMLPLLRDGAPAAGFGSALLGASAVPPRPLASRRVQVCNCFDVDEATIVGVLAGCDGDDARRLVQLQTRLRCGTQCGSCLPALKALVQAHPPAGSRPVTALAA
ncbi:molybdopterin-dependent oxidoreductase [Azohydromonas sediminis]|uniref:nitrate reductase n=1 Tax=Azohydromonas sediminis TaxID=2259674 RepID=UPI000E64D9C1|nr:nitrate reductase [Azohydromonas sediminis]